MRTRLSRSTSLVRLCGSSSGCKLHNVGYTYYKSDKRLISTIKYNSTLSTYVSSYSPLLFIQTSHYSQSRKDAREIMRVVMSQSKQKKKTKKALPDWMKAKNVNEYHKISKKSQTEEADPKVIQSAVKDENMSALKALIDRSKDLKETDQTMLMLAAQYKGTGLTEKLLRYHNADPTESDTYGLTALHYAIATETPKIAELLLEHATAKNIDTQDIQGASPLHIAAITDSEDLIYLLLEYGANVSIKDIHGETPLHYASKYGSDLATRILIANGAEVDAINLQHETPLHLASVADESEIAQILLDAGSNAMIRDNDGNTILHKAALNRDCKDVLQVLMNSEWGKELLTDTLNHGISPLHMAASSGNLDAVRIFLDSGCLVNDKASDGWTPLQLASQAGNIACVSTLLKRGASINQLNDLGMTALHSGIESREIVQFLLSNGADPNISDGNGFAALHYVIGQDDVTSTSLIDLLLDHRADINAMTREDKATPLQMAILQKSLDKVTRLLEKGADIECRDSDLGNTVRLAVAMSWVDGLNVILKFGGKKIINHVDEDDQTALDYAMQQGFPKVELVLKQNGAKTGTQVLKAGNY